MPGNGGETVGGRDVLLITLGFPPARGGIQSWMRERSRYLAERIVVLAPACRDAEAFDRDEGYPIYRWPALFCDVPGAKRFCQFLFPLWIAWGLLRRYPVGVIECGQALPFGLVAWFFWKMRGVRYRVWAYGDDILKPAAAAWSRHALLFILRSAACVIAVSEFGRQRVIALGIPVERTRVIYPVSPTSCFKASIGQREKGWHDELPRPRLLTVARLEQRKGIDVVLRMLPALQKHFPGVRYRIVGEGPVRAELASLVAQLKVSEHVDFLGDLSDQQVHLEYMHCDLFVLFSTPDEKAGEAEGFGIVYLEAAACGRPAVGWRTGGVDEAVLNGHTGLLVGPGDEVAALTAIVRLLSDGAERRRMGEAARTWAEQMADRTRQALESLDDNVGGSRPSVE